MSNLAQLSSLIGALTLADVEAGGLTSIEVESLLVLKKKIDKLGIPIVDAVLKLLMSDLRLQAIKKIRDEYGLSIPDAKDIVEKFQNQVDRRKWLIETLSKLQQKID